MSGETGTLPVRDGRDRPVVAGTPCPVCGHDDPRPVVELADVPVLTNELWSTRSEALDAPLGPIRLVTCPECGLLWNTAFDPSVVDYTQRYENSLHFSATFRVFAMRLAERLVAEHGLRGGTVLEVGAGKGEFLELLCAVGGCRGLGFDPSHPGGAQGGSVRLVAAELRDVLTEPADLVVCRHVLEHVADPIAFLRDIRRANSGRPAPLYLEVPNGRHMLDELAIWDLIYEHHTYFTERALRASLSLAGFETLRIRESFGGQYLSVDARPGRGDSDVPEPARPVAPLARDFAAHVAVAIDRWREVAASASPDRPVVVWGVGSKGVTFLNLVRPPQGATYAIDVNPRKHARFVPGTGHEILGPDALRQVRPRTVLMMNEAYAAEIRATLHSLGVPADVDIA